MQVCHFTQVENLFSCFLSVLGVPAPLCFLIAYDSEALGAVVNTFVKISLHGCARRPSLVPRLKGRLTARSAAQTVVSRYRLTESFWLKAA